MKNSYFSILKIFKTKTFCTALIFCIMSVYVFNFSLMEVEAGTNVEKALVVPSHLLDKSFFRENEQSTVIVRPRFKDGSENIIFYIDYGNNNFQYVAETIMHKDLPFSNYYSPAPGIGKYVGVEYLNDGKKFGCSGISLRKCIEDPHFVSQFSFEITSNDTINSSLTTANPSGSAVTDFISGQSQFIYIGKINTHESCTVHTTVTTALTNSAWAEVALFKGKPIVSGVPALTKVGSADVSHTFNSTGIKSTQIALSHSVAGDDIWVALGSSATVPFQVRGVDEPLTSEVFRTVRVRLSETDASVETENPATTTIPTSVNVTCQ